MKNKIDKSTQDFLTAYVDLLVSGNPQAEAMKSTVRKTAEKILDEHIDKVKNDPNYEVPKSEIGDGIDNLAKSVKKVFDKQELIKDLMGKIIRKTYPPEVKGGQHAGVSAGVTLYCEEFEIEISIYAHRSQHKNLLLATTLMGLALDDLIK